MKDTYASQVEGTDERMQGRIEAFDEVWSVCWPDLKRVLVISALVFLGSIISKWLGWFDDITPNAIKWSFIVLCLTYFVAFWLEFNLSRSVSIMIGTGVARKIKER